MNLFRLARSFLAYRGAVSLLAIASLAAGIALVLVVLHIRRDVERSFFEQTAGVDIIAGASGSETALVLAGLFHADRPRGNVSHRAYLDLRKQPGVIRAIPFSLGDQYKGARIVGTTEVFLEKSGTLQLAEGDWPKAPLEIVAGASAAKRLSLVVGAKFAGSHGVAKEGEVEHAEHPYTVVGILKATGSAHDRALFTTLESYWTIHGQDKIDPRAFGMEKEVTLVLLHVSKPLLFQLKSLIPKRFGMMAVRPAEVMQSVFEEVFSPIERVILAYGGAVIAVAIAGMLAILYLTNKLNERELALLRAIGATRSDILILVVMQAFLLLIVGASLGVVVSQALGEWLRNNLEFQFGLAFGSLRFTRREVLAILCTVGAGTLLAIIPAALQYRKDVSDLLRK